MNKAFQSMQELISKGTFEISFKSPSSVKDVESDEFNKTDNAYMRPTHPLVDARGFNSNTMKPQARGSTQFLPFM